MKKTLGLVLMTVVLVASLGFAPVASASSVGADGKAEVGGRGTLTAQGDGIAIIGGNGSVNIAGNGILWVRDLAGDADINVTGHGKKKEFSDGWIQYSGFGGSADVEGTRIIVVLAGVGIDLSAQGRGRAILWGHGSYQINGQSNEWSQGFTRSINLASTGVK